MINFRLIKLSPIWINDLTNTAKIYFTDPMTKLLTKELSVVFSIQNQTLLILPNFRLIELSPIWINALTNVA